VLTCSTSSPARLSSILRLPVQKTHKGLVEALRGKPAQWQAEAAEIRRDRGQVRSDFRKHPERGELLAFRRPCGTRWTAGAISAPAARW